MAVLKGRHPSGNFAAFSPDGATLAACNSDGTVTLWNFRTRQEVATLHTGPAGRVAFSPDGRTPAVAGANTIRLWNLAIRQEVATLWGHTSQVGCITFSSDGNALATAGGDATVRLWRAAPFAETDAPGGSPRHPSPP
jgi:WD40 repeat protein